MATVSANELSLEKTLEELITEFNSLRGDVSAVTLESLISAASSQIVFEGATDDANETTLTVVDPTADRTVTLPDATGTVVTTGNADVGATTTTFADLDQFLIADGAVLKKMALSTIAASLPALTPASANANALGSAALEWSDLFLGDGSVINFGNDQDTTLTHTDGAGLTLNSTNKLMFNDASQFIQGASATVLDIAATDEIELTATLIDVVGNLAVSGTVVGASTIQGTTITATTAFVPDAQDGAALGTTSLQFSDLFLADSAVIGFGDDNDTTLTHTDGAGLTLNSTNKLMFNDASQFIQGASATVLDIAATDEIELTATLIDVVGNLTASGIIKTDNTTEATSTTDGSLQTDGGLSVAKDIVAGDDIKLLSDASVIAFGANGDVTLTHVHDTGILLNGTMQLQFNDASQNINAPSATVLDINATDEIELNATLADVNANLDVSGTIVGASTISGTSITASTSFLPDAQDGAALGTTSLQFSDLFLADGAVIGFGDNNEVTLTHVHDTGILLNSTNVIQFNDASQNIGAPSATVLDINATDEIELNATLVDINANVEISGNLSVAGTTTQVNTVTMNAQNAVIFEGATADASETTLTITDPTADRTITLPDETGTVHTSGGSITIPNGGTIGSAGDADAITIASGGGVTLTQTLVSTAITASGIIKTDDSTAATSTTDGSLQTDGGLSVVLDAVIGDDIILISDAAQIAFGVNSEITLKHVHDVGLTLTHVTAGDNLPIVLQLKSEEDVIVADEVIASLEFAAGDSDGTDGATVAAGIHAIAEGTFSASANATKLVFTTGVSETAASSATAKMTLSSAGLLTIADDLIIKNAGTIGTAADADLLTMGNGNLTVAGTVTATAGATLLIKNASGSTLKTIKGMT
mgnify:FL=1|jgi:hypothetical protein